jgi:hypothetical protein
LFLGVSSYFKMLAKWLCCRRFLLYGIS